MKQKLIIKGICFFLMLTFSQVAFPKCIVCLRSSNGWSCNYYETLNCVSAFVGEGYNNLNGTYCKNYMIKQNTPPIIRTSRTGKAFLDNNGEIIQIASDKAIEFWKKAAKRTSDEIKKFCKTDDGVVTQKRLDAIAKNLGASIVKSDKRIIANYCPACDEEKERAKWHSEVNTKKKESIKKAVRINSTKK